jgi:GT2 family glycosyltransferase
MLDISVVINTRDQPEALRLCLGALEAQTLDPKRWEIVVADDGSQDAAGAVVAQAYGGRSRCTPLRLAPAGRAAARNAGLRAAQGNLVLFLGDDILGAPDLLEEHLRAHARHPGAAVVGLYEWTPECPSEAFRAWVDNCRFRDIHNADNAGFRFFYTGNVSAPRDALLAAGGFDENFALYGWEDIDLGWRLERRGLRIVHHPRAFATHHHPRVSLEALCRREYEMAFSAAYFFDKWRDEPEIKKDRFWPDGMDLRRTAPSALRRAVGKALIHAFEAVWPSSFLLTSLYNRLIWSFRYEGLRDGVAHYGPLLEKWREGKYSAEELTGRFQK